jgi:hypothetical protein
MNLSPATREDAVTMLARSLVMDMADGDIGRLPPGAEIAFLESLRGRLRELHLILAHESELPDERR